MVDEETVDSPTLASGALQRAPAPIPYSVGDGALSRVLGRPYVAHSR